MGPCASKRAAIDVPTNTPSIEEIVMSEGYHDGIDKGKKVGPDIKLNIEELNPVQRRIVIALKAMKRKPEFKETNFTKVLLKFSKIRKTLTKVKDIFAAVDTDGDGLIDIPSIDTCLKKLKSDIAGEELHDFFNVSAVSKGDKEEIAKMNHKEFLVALIICYILRSIPMLATPMARRMSIDGGDKTPPPPAAKSPRPSGSQTPTRRRKNSVTGLFTSSTNDDLRSSFDLMVHAYLLFDKDAKGYIAKSDVSNMMKEEGAGEGQFFLQEERWGEMDWNNDGTIEFSEFIYTFSRWVDIDED
mmetsp:Transcript_16439/g.33875  ORF Transcript_16439/g.33875 Transcript_16439/m.33875 type:complete len:300 (-) Transcript_16439:129-1028(-)|eukprot:CAMPEP_0118659386 /NCGR_PEP_ID=MMETSP0785-20121206/15081_1 /TAXON_ID=91992 /ORGANISM="Bolidomonas pacifica, Strain CCMP 1866" /LENGTH=299 /DNA_ID=CAMNT_0006552481 /DNA_START=107 /DNA_END=1006 /DNA_ORIENTATION=-